MKNEKKNKIKLSPLFAVLTISPLGASLDNDQPRSITKPLQSGFRLTVLLISSNTTRHYSLLN